MALPNQWSTTVAQGSSVDWQFTLQNADSSSYNATGYTWEYVVRAPRTRADSTPAIRATTTAAPAGQITVTTSPTTTVTVALTPAATTDLAAGNYEHALWSNPGTDQAFLWFEGTLVIQAVPQP